MVFFIGILCILITVSLHAMTVSALIAIINRRGPQAVEIVGHTARPMLVAYLACALAVKHAVDIVFWGFAIWLCAGEEFTGLSEAIYFSSVTYTTLGYGDIVLSGDWRMLSAFEATNGMLLFGLSTALLFVLVERMWLRDV